MELYLKIITYNNKNKNNFLYVKPGPLVLGKQLFNFFFFFLVFLLFLWAAPACGGSQAKGRIGAVAAGLHQSHSNAESEPGLQPTPQLTATPDR